MVKFFLNRRIEEDEAQLNALERPIVAKILTKKKFFLEPGEPLDWRSLNRLRQVKQKKKNEDELKFVLKKGIRRLQERFLADVACGKALGHPALAGVTAGEVKRNKDKFFYRFHFQAIAAREGLPIERFYHFRSWKNRHCSGIPKSITRESLELWKKNAGFVAQIRHYIRGSLRKDFFAFNARKIRTLVAKWRKTLARLGPAKGLCRVLAGLDSKGSKLPWTLSEVDTAIAHSLKCLD